MRTARRRIALQSAGPLLQLDLPQSERGSLAGVEDLGGAEQISEVRAGLSFDLQGWAAFIAARRRALLFLYRAVLEKEVGELEGLVRAKRRRKLPVVLTAEEVKRILSRLEGEERVFLSLLYGTGMHLLEALRLRVKDVDFAYDQITIRDGKGAKDRVTMLPASLKAELREQP